MPSSGYTAITFVANEQPTTAKWNLIGSNDSAFNLGTGLEDSTIIARHIAANIIQAAKIDWTTAGQIWWQELARVTLASGGSTMATGSFTPRKYLRVMYTGYCSATMTELLRFNSDTGNNYNWTKSSNWSALSGSTNTNGIQGGASLSQRWYTFDIQNVATQEKNISFFWNYDVGSGAGTTNAIEVGVGKWINTAAQISSITYITTAGAWIAGSELIVLGHD